MMIALQFPLPVGIVDGIYKLFDQRIRRVQIVQGLHLATYLATADKRDKQSQ